jgi:aspartyl-tRNA(Asn)/glutamyl-tRNA(Gln) amidotransferase subunit A
VRASVDRLAALGAEVGEATLPHGDYTLSGYYLLAPSEASSNLARYDGVRYGYRAEGADSVEMMSRTRGEGFGPEVKRRIMLGTYALSAGYYEAYYGQAQKVRTLIIRDYEKAFERFDVLVSPTSPTTAFRIGERADDPLAMYL